MIFELLLCDNFALLHSPTASLYMERKGTFASADSLICDAALKMPGCEDG